MVSRFIPIAAWISTFFARQSNSLLHRYTCLFTYSSGLGISVGFPSSESTHHAAMNIGIKLSTYTYTFSSLEQHMHWNEIVGFYGQATGGFCLLSFALALGTVILFI